MKDSYKLLITDRKYRVQGHSNRSGYHPLHDNDQSKVMITQTDQKSVIRDQIYSYHRIHISSMYERQLQITHY